jgi:hypothetical protein
MRNYFFNQSREGAPSLYINVAPAAFFKSQSDSKDKALFSAVSFTNGAREGNKKSEQWKLKDRIKLKDKTARDSFNSPLSLQCFFRPVKSAFFIQLNRARAIPILFALILFNPISVWAATYYISPSGSDSNSGTSTSYPWRTFNSAIRKLRPGDTLVLMNGTYTKSTTGLLNISCGSSGNAVNGTATQPITIAAQNERQAFLKSDGSVSALKMLYCSYWNIQGLRFEGGDYPVSSSTQVWTVWILYSKNINVRKVLVAKHNRYSNNVGTFAISYSDTVLVEDSEIYYSLRHLLNCFSSQRCTFRRIYANARSFPTISGGTTGVGDRSVAFYVSSNSIMENVIVEGDGKSSEGMQIHDSSDGNAILGSIAINAHYNGFRLDSRGTTSHLVTNTVLENIVALDTNDPGGFGGIYQQGAVNTHVTNATVLNSYGSPGTTGIKVDGTCGNCGGAIVPNASFFATNILGTNNKWSGVNVNSSRPTRGGWNMDYTNAVYHTVNFVPTTGDSYGSYTNKRTVDPQLGSCIVYIPSGSPMKGVGENGADIGANIVYRYQDGFLTNQKLWNQTTGQFPCGAVVSGVNDDATFPSSSCINVNERLNVGVNGCPIP